MGKKLLISAAGLLVLALILGALTGVKFLQFGAMGKAASAMVPPPESVSAAEVVEQIWERSLRAVGSVAPVQGVVLQAEIPGIVSEIAFRNGQSVKAGDLLVQLDVDVEKAQLRSAQATLKLSELEYERARTLRESGTIPQAQLDTAVANLERARAEIENIEATISNKTIRAPFYGEVGIRQVNTGQYVPQGAPVVSLQAFEQVYVNFSLPQQDLAKIGEGMTVRIRSDVFPGRTFTGTLTAISPEVDATTRTVDLQATFDNEERLLRSGLFVEAEVVLPETETVLVVPATAILYAPYGDSVYVVEEQSGEDGAPAGLVARQQFIRTGRALGDYVSVTKGLEAGQRVVSAGVFKLRNGASIAIDNTLAPEPERNPEPDNS